MCYMNVVTVLLLDFYQPCLRDRPHSPRDPEPRQATCTYVTHRLVLVDQQLVLVVQLLVLLGHLLLEVLKLASRVSLSARLQIEIMRELKQHGIPWTHEASYASHASRDLTLCNVLR